MIARIIGRARHSRAAAMAGFLSIGRATPGLGSVILADPECAFAHLTGISAFSSCHKSIMLSTRAGMTPMWMRRPRTKNDRASC